MLSSKSVQTKNEKKKTGLRETDTIAYDLVIR